MYGGGQGTGITLPDYYKPTPSVVSASNFFPLSEELGADEMRISFLGSCPFPPSGTRPPRASWSRPATATACSSTSAPAASATSLAMQVPLPTINDIFITHLHVDHYGEFPYLYVFAPWAGRWTPLRCTARPAGKKNEGIAQLTEGMKEMTHLAHQGVLLGRPARDTRSRSTSSTRRMTTGSATTSNGITVRHWRRSHNMDGASAYRLDWNGLSFVWTGDGRPDTLTAEISRRASTCSSPSYRQIWACSRS